MKRYFFIISLMYTSVTSFAQIQTSSNTNSDQTKSAVGTNPLFQGTTSKLTSAEKNQIFTTLNLKLSKDNNQFILDDFPVDVEVLPTDMNKDNNEEIFIGMGSTALFGNVGQSFSLFIKNRNGVYQQHTEIAGGRPLLLSTKNLGYPDIVIGGPGMEFPVVRWNGEMYVFYKKIKDEDLANLKPIDISELSKSYTSTIQK